MLLVANLRLLFLGLWLGAAIFFSAVVAPAAFSVLRGYGFPNASEIAGGIVNRSLAAINVSGFVIAVLLLLSVFLYRSNQRSFLWLELFALAVVACCTAVGQWIIAAKIHSLRMSLQLPVEQLAGDDPRRLLFQSLHSYSVAALSIAIIAALIAFFAFARRA